MMFAGATVRCGSASVYETDNVKAYRKNKKTVIIYTNKQHIYVKRNHKKGEHTTITKTTTVVIDKDSKKIKTKTKRESWKHGKKEKKTQN